MSTPRTVRAQSVAARLVALADEDQTDEMTDLLMALDRTDCQDVLVIFMGWFIKARNVVTMLSRHSDN